MRNVTKIFGAPGCGKTTRLMHILEEELKTHEPNEIAFVSFTRKGTYEGVERARAKFGYDDDDLPYFRTLHSIAFRSGKHAKTDMLSKRDYKEFSDALGMKFTGYYTEEFYHNDDMYLFILLLEQNNPAMVDRYIMKVNVQRLDMVRSNYEAYKKHTGRLDFTDIIANFVKRNRALPVKVAIIDEAQDLTTLQWQMCLTAFKDCERVYVAGDDDQAIYEWSGADVGMFLDLEGQQEVLGKSYRLPSRVLASARRVSDMISRRVPKEFEPTDVGGEVLFYNSLEELEIKPDESYYFLSRNNWFLKQHANYLKSKALVFSYKDEPSYNPKHIAAINAFEKLRKGQHLSDAEDLKLKQFVPEHHDLSKPWFDNLTFDNDETAYYKDLIRTKADLKDKRISVDTIHGVKGGEADNVVLLMDFTRAVRDNFEQNPDSELRCLYVAFTRAKKSLNIIHSSSKNGYDYYIGEEA
jgi:superfamily I DNA/RNA helicase